MTVIVQICERERGSFFAGKPAADQVAVAFHNEEEAQGSTEVDRRKLGMALYLPVVTFKHITQAAVYKITLAVAKTRQFDGDIAHEENQAGCAVAKFHAEDAFRVRASIRKANNSKNRENGKGVMAESGRGNRKDAYEEWQPGRLFWMLMCDRR
jgi:hypothetical protein